MDRAAFLVRYPEFTEAPTALVDAILAESETVVRSDTPTALRDVHVGARTAYELSRLPGGRALRLPPTGGDADKAESPYEREWRRIMRFQGLDGVAL